MGSQPSGARGLLEKLGRAFAVDPMQDAKRAMARVAQAKAATADRTDLTLSERVELADRREDERAARRLEELKAACEEVKAACNEHAALVEEARQADREKTIRRLHDDEGDPDANLAAVLEAGRRHRALRQPSRRAEHRLRFLLPRRPACRNHRPRARRTRATGSSSSRGDPPPDGESEPHDLVRRRPSTSGAPA